MNYTFNFEKINALLYDFYKSTGIAVGFYDSLFNPIGGSNVLSPYCEKIKSNNFACKQCDMSNLKGMRIAEKDNKTLVYTCHAGLVETITPVVFNGIIIAYMQTGQFIDQERVYSNQQMVKACEETYGFKKGELTALYNALPVVSKEKLSALNNIMDVLIKSLWEHGLISLSHSANLLKIEKYLLDNLEYKITLKNVCDKFYLSKNAVYRLFYQEFKMPFGEYVNKLRLEKAQRLLKENKDLSVLEVSSLCGFTDSNYFIRAFKKRFNVTPHKFKKQV